MAKSDKNDDVIIKWKEKPEGEDDKLVLVSDEEEVIIKWEEDGDNKDGDKNIKEIEEICCGKAKIIEDYELPIMDKNPPAVRRLEEGTALIVGNYCYNSEELYWQNEIEAYEEKKSIWQEHLDEVSLELEGLGYEKKDLAEGFILSLPNLPNDSVIIEPAKDVLSLEALLSRENALKERQSEYKKYLKAAEEQREHCEKYFDEVHQKAKPRLQKDITPDGIKETRSIRGGPVFGRQ